MPCDLTGVLADACSSRLAGNPRAQLEALVSVLLARGGLTLAEAQAQACDVVGLNDLALLESSISAMNTDGLTGPEFSEEACDLNLSGYSDEAIMLMTIQVVCNQL